MLLGELSMEGVTAKSAAAVSGDSEFLACKDNEEVDNEYFCIIGLILNAEADLKSRSRAESEVDFMDFFIIMR